jgi:hypothetical protein
MTSFVLCDPGNRLLHNLPNSQHGSSFSGDGDGTLIWSICTQLPE